MLERFRLTVLGGVVALVTTMLPVMAAAATSSAEHVETRTPTSIERQRHNTSEFRGVNWADPRDNYASDEVVPSGLSSVDDYDSTYVKSSAILEQFRRKLKANTVRVPINPSSVGTAWWRSYRAAIDAATRQGFRVIVSYWEANDAKDGRIDDQAAFNAMWDTVVGRYRSNPQVFFEPMNEPYGYILEEWVSVTSRWLSRHHAIPRNRVVISGTGYNDDVTGVGAAKELDGTVLSLHHYGYWADETTEDAWKARIESRIGGFGWRTIIDEAGAPMTTGLNYGNHTGNVYTSYFAALTEIARNQHMGVVYWPGLRTGDSYSMTTLSDKDMLVVSNPSGLAQLLWGWRLIKKEPVNNLPPSPPGEILRGVPSNRCIDVPAFSTTSGTALGLWDCGGEGNQLWNWTTSKELRIYATKCLAIGPAAEAGTPAVIADCTGAREQRWQLGADLSITNLADPGRCLDVAAASTENGAAVQVRACDGRPSQQWVRS